MSWDSTWETVFREREWGRYPAEELIRFVVGGFSYLSPRDRSGVTIAELGCGPGANLWYLAREGYQIFGIDGSCTAVKQARARLDLEVPEWKGTIEVGDIEQLSLPDASIEAVVDAHAIGHNSFESAQRAYREAARVLVRGGKLYSRTFSTECWGYETGKARGLRAWEPSEGPLSGLGLVRFTAIQDVPRLLGDAFTRIGIDVHSRTVGGVTSGRAIVDLVITAEKA